MVDHCPFWLPQVCREWRKFFLIWAKLQRQRWKRRCPLPESGNTHRLPLTKQSWLGNGPQKSMLTVCQGLGGSFTICNGWGELSRLVAWHGMHRCTISSTVLSILGSQIFSLRSRFVFTIPWWPSWASSIAFLRKLWGSTNLDPRRIKGRCQQR